MPSALGTELLLLCHLLSHGEQLAQCGWEEGDTSVLNSQVQWMLTSTVELLSVPLTPACWMRHAYPEGKLRKRNDVMSLTLLG